MNEDLKVAILRSGRTQRQISLAALIPEGRLSDLIRERARPNPEERAALRQILGHDYFQHPAGAAQ